MQEPEIRQSRLTFLWFLPIIALGIGLYLAYNRMSKVGPTIEIAFKTAEGLEAGKTKIRYKNLAVGTVTDVALSANLDHIIVTAQMLRSAEPLLKKDSEFWVVRPEISTNGISGLGTLISGNYISVSPGKSDQQSEHFIGLDEAPLIQNNEAGLRIHLMTDSISGINTGTVIYYRGIKVGQIEQIKFDDKFEHLNLTAFIHEPYDKLITSNTKFWDISGFSFNIGAGGADFEMQSVETLLMGGITFSTPASFSSDKGKIADNAVFTLYPNERATTQPGSFNKEYYVVYFDDSIRGLQTGAPVAFNGIDIGQVIDIRLLYDETSNKAVIPVLIELEPGRIKRVNRNNRGQNIIADLVSHGLQASLESGSLITGDKLIKLSNYPNDIKSLTHDPYSDYLVLPSRSTGITKLTDDITTIVSTVKNLPLEEIANNAKDATAALKTALDNPSVKNIGPQLDKTLASIQKAGNSADKTLTGLNIQLKVVTKQLEKTLYGLSPESNLYYTLNETLKIVQRTAKSINNVMRKIDDKPNVLIMGE